MNLIDNGISKVLSIRRIIEEEEMYFLVTFLDYYDRERTKKLASIKNLEKVSWTE